MKEDTIDELDKKILETYLEYLGCSKKPLFVTTNNLADMSFCPNKAYLQVNFLGGISEYKFRLEMRNKEREHLQILFKKKKKWKLTKNALKEYLLQELWSFTFIHKALNKLPYDIRTIAHIFNFDRTEMSITENEKLFNNGIFHSHFRINFGIQSFFISAVPDVVLIKDKKIKGVIEIKSTQKPLKDIFPSESDQVDFYRYYMNKRNLPLDKEAYFFTLKKIGKPKEIENEIVKFLLLKRNFKKESIIQFASSNHYLIKESEESLKEIKRKLNERINLLSQDNLPTKHCRWSRCSFKEFCEEFEVIFYT